MDAIREWLQASLKLGPSVQDLVLFPLLAAVLAWAGRAIFLAVVSLRVADPRRKAAIKARSAYVLYVPGIALFVGIWLSVMRQIASLFGDRSPEELERIRATFNGVLYALLSVAALILLIRFIQKAVAMVSDWVDRWAASGEPIRFRGLDLISRSRIRESVLVVTRATRIVFIALLLYIQIPLLLSFFPATAPLGSQLMQYVTQPATEIFRAVIGYIPNLIYIAVVILVIRYCLKIIRFFLNAVGRGDLVLGTFERDWADPTYKLLRSLLVVFTLMIVFPYLPGSGSEFFQGFSLFVGALLTLGSAGVVGNLVAGIILTYSRAFRVGERVRIGESVGDVLSKSLFVTRLRTAENEEITVPNGLVLGGQVTNYSRAAEHGELVLRAEVGIGYDVHWTRMERLLAEAAARTEGILDSPPPVTWIRTLGDFAVVYELRAMTDRASRMGRVCSDLRRSVLDVLHDAGVEIMTPAVQAVRDASRVAVPAQNAGGEARPPQDGIRVEVVPSPRIPPGSSGGSGES